MSGAPEIVGATDGLLDDPLELRVRGLGPAPQVTWRARLRDDDGRVWRASAPRAEPLADAWGPAKGGTGEVAALRSLRPVAIDVRVEAADGRAAARTLTRRLLAAGVRRRRWRGDLSAVLLLPAGPPCATVLLFGPTEPAAELAAGLLASRGAVVLSVGGDDDVGAARERLAKLPGTPAPSIVVSGAELVLPPGVPARPHAGDPAARAAAWDVLLARLGLRLRKG